MKMNRTFREWSGNRLWAGLLVLLALGCAEFWMVCRFSRDCAQSAAQAELAAGFAVPQTLFESP